MKAMNTVILAVTTVLALPSFATECWVVGQDPQNPTSYNRLKKHITPTEFEKSQILFQEAGLVVSHSKSDEGRIFVATSRPGFNFLSAAATGSAESVTLIDGNLKVSVICSQ